MKRFLTIIGARPQIIKAAALSRAFSQCAEAREYLLHTGQHYDSNMSQVFFDELGIPAPDFNLGVGSGSHGTQTARMMEGIEAVLTGRFPGSEGIHWDGVVLYGDTNSTLAGAVAAAKLQIPVFHIEAGLRSFNMAMPEELNRILCDQLSTMLFAPTQTAVDNLRREGFMDGDRARFADGRGRSVLLSGDVMLDNSLFYSKLAETKSHITELLGVKDQGYILATIHRPANTDHPQQLQSIFQALVQIAKEDDIPVVLPLHPRTAKLMETQLTPALLAEAKKYLTIIPPASFFDIIQLEKHARIVMTDSGGVQKEAFFFGKPCVILRPETEWTEIINHGAGILADADYERILSAYRQLSGTEFRFPPLFGDGHAAAYILKNLIA